MDLIKLDLLDLLLVLGLMGLTVLLSWGQKLGLAGQLTWAAVRMIVQLVGVGYLLDVVFALEKPLAVMAIILGMITVAAIAAKRRIGLAQSLPMLWGSIFTSTAVVLVYVDGLILQPPQWYSPQYLIPLAGIIIGNAMNGAALAGEKLMSALRQNRSEIETHLSLGASPAQAIASYRRQALRAATVPVMNQMMVIGIVTLPGIMTGQLLGGIKPLEATSYQILIMFTLAFADLLTGLLTTEGIYRQFFNSQEQLQFPK